MKAIILDMDGVVVDSEPIHRRTFRILLGPLGIRYSVEEYAERFAGTGAEYIMATMLKEHGIKADVDAWVKKRTALYQKLIRGRRLRPIAGLRSFLGDVKRKGIKLAIASGGHRTNVISSLKSVGFKPKDFVILSVENVPKRKPNPALFLAAARALHTRPNDCVVFEDSVVGVQAAKRAKMRCVALLTTTNREALKKAGADITVKDFRDNQVNRFLENII